MLGKIAVTINSSTTSVIVVDNQEKVACGFTGFIDQNGTPNITKSIRDRQLYMDNRETCDQDYDDFEDYLLGLVPLE